MTRREMLNRLGADELEEWRAFNRISPFGDERADLRMARICQAAAASQGWKTSLGQWLLFGVERVEQSMQAMAIAARTLGKWFSGNKRRNP